MAFLFCLRQRPALFYFVALIAYFLGPSFLTMKISSALVGLGIVLGIYLLSKEIFNPQVGLVAAFLTAVSKWSLVFSRLGNMNILVPFFIVFSAIIYFKIIKNPSRYFGWALLGICLGVGMYNYPAYLVFPVAIYFLFLLQGPKFLLKNFGQLLLMTVIFFFLASYFIRMFLGNLPSYTSSSSYFGHKIFVADSRLASDWPQRLINNLRKTISMFHHRGDPGFRVNPPGDPQLDRVSSLFFWLGLVFILIRRQQPGLSILILALFLIIPGVLVLNVPASIPSSTITIGLFPLVYLLTAIGLTKIYETLTFLGRKLNLFMILLILLAISLINAQKYFIQYAYHLPNHNESFSRLIAQELDKLPGKTAVFMYGGGWGDWGNPDWRAVEYEMRIIRPYFHIESGELSCSLFENNSLAKYFILNPHSPQALKELKSCFPQGESKTHYSPQYHFPVFFSYSPEESI